MKQKIAIINFVLSLTVLFSILFQSVHSYVHQSEINTEQIAKQKFSKNKSEVTRNNHTINLKCAACDFQFSCFTASDFFLFQFVKTTIISTINAVVSTQKFSFFTGSFFSLRAPPTF